MVCDKGGAQNRTLGEVYEFIRLQLDHIIKYKPKNTYFINIVDGDNCFHKKKHFHLLKLRHKRKK